MWPNLRSGTASSRHAGAMAALRRGISQLMPRQLEGVVCGAKDSTFARSLPSEKSEEVCQEHGGIYGVQAR